LTHVVLFVQQHSFVQGATKVPPLLDEPLNRRYAIGAISTTTAGLLLQNQIRVRAIIQRGIFGGGLVGFEGGAAQFSLFASKFSFDDGEPDVVVGRVMWNDGPTRQRFVSTVVTTYEAVASVQERQREVRTILGAMRVNNQNEYPFRLTVIDAGPPGTAADSVALIVGRDAALESTATPVAPDDFIYAVAGSVIVGDVQGIDVNIIGDVVREAEATT
jgi:hypothetical protein